MSADSPMTLPLPQHRLCLCNWTFWALGSGSLALHADMGSWLFWVETPLPPGTPMRMKNQHFQGNRCLNNGLGILVLLDYVSR